MKATVFSLDHEKSGDIELSDAIYGVAVRGDILTRVVNYQRAKARSGTHKVKERSEIAHTTRKSIRQKGSGSARHGSRRVNIFRGGGIVHGPRPRDHGHKLPKKVRALGLKTALAAKVKEGCLTVIESTKIERPKTRELKAKMDRFGTGSVLVIDGTEVNQHFRLAAGNIVGLDVLPTAGANVYDILRHDKVFLTRSAVAAIEARLLRSSCHE